MKSKSHGSFQVLTAVNDQLMSFCAYTPCGRRVLCFAVKPASIFRVGLNSVDADVAGKWSVSAIWEG